MVPRRKITWMTIEEYEKAESFEKFKVKANKKEIAVYSAMGINLITPGTWGPVTNKFIKKAAIKTGWLR